MVVLGTVFAVIIAKQLYGGLGHNPFNPAMIGYVVLLISFPVQMTSWLPPHEIAATVPGFMDALHVIFTGHRAGRRYERASHGRGRHQSGHSARYLQNLPACRTKRGAGDEIVYLQRRTGRCWLAVGQSGLPVGWRVPAATEGDPLAYSGELPVTLAVCSTLGWVISPESLASPQLHLLSGATMLGAFFILTDPVTASTTNRGRLIFGALAGLLVWLIRSFGGYPDGVAFAVLLANITVPLIDYYASTRVRSSLRVAPC